ncbi:LOW QUALITY PROTEIN: calcium-activated chloride channel regulator 3A-1-like [Cyprinus carpio]|uniref:LOW QUALITY PROTEIN: calcium-activated chloride channel regulator 3A-1-like n=1 Tax=Cyprinus carpio TaxID=7962 RepID=A0A9Q9X4P0_CYPCA|nr:LOW QUALITY PROTEIN: calcium-activated chloride channel regulator 3A-1-like [Cyprinus carpio]
MDSRAVIVLLWMLLSSTSTGIKLDGNGYVDIIIAIGSRVPQDDMLIDKIKEMVTEGSYYLYDALDEKVYFKDATILVPSHWSVKDFSKARTESFEKAHIKIDYANSANNIEPYTKQYGECGDEGEFIHFTPEYLLNDTLIELYGSRGRVLVHEWAHLRWGVYDENNDKKPFYYSNGRIEPTRCSKNIEGQFYEVTAGGSLQQCRSDPETLLLTKECTFFPDRNQITNSSIMFLPSLDPVTAFCHENEHKNKNPKTQKINKSNKATWTVIFEDSVDKDALRSLKPPESPPPPPSFKIVQRKQRVVCLILDVSGSMRGSRILLQQQAATHFLRNIIEEQASVGIVQFSTSASTLSPLTTIDSDNTRENLIKMLPKVADGWTNMCLGLSQGLQVLTVDNGDALGDEIIFLTDGEATDNIELCAPSAIKSGAIISTVAFGKKAATALIEMAEQTGGKFIYANDELTSNQLMDAFASFTFSTGDYTKEPVQLESVGKRTSDWFNGTVSVDQTVGNKTSFVIIYELSFPSVYIQSPSGLIYTQTNTSHDKLLKTVTLNVPGTAEPGDWQYSIQTTILQAFTLTVTSQAAQADVPPITVKTRMNQKSSDGTKPMIVFAEVSQNYRPVINAEVWATLESETGIEHTFQLLDNGAGADASQGDGIYSRYFTKMVNGRSSLKVRVKNQEGQTRLAAPKKSGAPYVPGYVVNGVVQLNPPKPPVSEEPLEVGSFTRTATGESFEVTLSGTAPPNFPPNRITDLSAEIHEDTVLLNWTAPGEDLDQGTAKSYEIRWSFDLDMLRDSFSNGHVVNTAAVSPQEAGSVEQHSFNLSFPIQNGTTLSFAIQSEDEVNATSETSNIAQASKILRAPKPPGISNPGMNLTVLVISVCVVTMIICFIVAVTTWAVKRKKLSSESKVELTI